MELIKYFLSILLLLTLCKYAYTNADESSDNITDDELDDFEFENVPTLKKDSSESFAEDLYYPTEQEEHYLNKVSSSLLLIPSQSTSTSTTTSTSQSSILSFDDKALDDFDLSFDDEFDDDKDSNFNNNKPNAFLQKELQIREALGKSTKNILFRKHFTEVIPIIRILSKEQRLALAALISAQITSKPGYELNLQQVEKMFGDRKKLILPIVFDIANLIKHSANNDLEKLNTKHNKRYYPNGIQNNEQENIPSAQFLRRSLSVNDSENLSSPLTYENNLSKNSNIQDDRFQIDYEDEADDDHESLLKKSQLNDDKLIIVMDRKKNRAINSNVNGTIQYIPSNANTKDSYHELKLNMTNFNGNAKNGTMDQEAMASERISVRLELPRSYRVEDTEKNYNLSLEQIEALAFNDLNGTAVTTKSLYGEESDEGNSDELTENDGEALPTPEMLIRDGGGVGGQRYRKKPNRLNLDVLRQCERFGNVCLRVDNYPMQQIMGSIHRHRHAMSALLAEYNDNGDQLKHDKYIEQTFNKKRRGDDDEDNQLPGTMCPSVVRYARPQKARSAAGEWKYIVNTGQHTQTLRLEKCSNPQESCTYLTDNFKSRCLQIFNYHRLLSWDSTRGLHVDIFKVPTCCSCHIDSYRDRFPPVTSYNGPLLNHEDDYRYSASNIHTLQQHHHNNNNNVYTTINEDDEENEDDDSIAYQFSNGFKRSPSKYNKFSGDPLIENNPGASNSIPTYPPLSTFQSNLRYDHNLQNTKIPIPSINPTLESYLTPPLNINSDNYDFDSISSTLLTSPLSSSSLSSSSSSLSSFKRGPSGGKRHRRRPTHISEAPTTPIRTINNNNNNNYNTNDQFGSGSDFIPDVITPAVIHLSQSKRRVSTGIPSNAINKNVGINTDDRNLSTNKKTPGQLPSISTAPTSPVDLSKRVNYNYHPIIDFFSDGKSKKEIDNRMSNVNSEEYERSNNDNSWTPLFGDII